MAYEKYDSFDDFQAAQKDEQQNIISALRQLVNATATELTESVKWGNGCWLNGKLPVIYIHCKDDYVQLGFYGGAQLNDNYRILNGDGKYVRFIKVYSVKEINKEIVEPLIKQAKTHNYRRV